MSAGMSAGMSAEMLARMLATALVQFSKSRPGYRQQYCSFYRIWQSNVNYHLFSNLTDLEYRDCLRASAYIFFLTNRIAPFRYCTWANDIQSNIYRFVRSLRVHRMNMPACWQACFRRVWYQTSALCQDLKYSSQYICNTSIGEKSSQVGSGARAYHAIRQPKTQKLQM